MLLLLLLLLMLMLMLMLHARMHTLQHCSCIGAQCTRNGRRCALPSELAGRLIIEVHKFISPMLHRHCRSPADAPAREKKNPHGITRATHSNLSTCRA
jgi:hypothetical protein